MPSPLLFSEAEVDSKMMLKFGRVWWQNKKWSKLRLKWGTTVVTSMISFSYMSPMWIMGLRIKTKAPKVPLNLTLVWAISLSYESMDEPQQHHLVPFSNQKFTCPNNLNPNKLPCACLERKMPWNPKKIVFHLVDMSFA